MRGEKAIEHLKDINVIAKTRHMCRSMDGELEDGEIQVYRKRFESVKMAIKALEKQVPTPPENKVSEKYPSLGKNYYCKCGVMFTDWENYPTNYCGNCGQALEVRNER